MEQTGLEMITIKDVMKTLKVSRPTAYRLIVKWNISIFREGQLIRVFFYSKYLTNLPTQLCGDPFLINASLLLMKRKRGERIL